LKAEKEASFQELIPPELSLERSIEVREMNTNFCANGKSTVE
jgi:hypothetical protein